MRAKKSLGQNFLTSRGVTTAMIAAAEVDAHDTILEIGPGKGFLTRELLATGARVIAVEKDTELIPLLTATFASELASTQLTILTQDALTICMPHDTPYKIVANIPYYITGEILRYFLESDHQPTSMTLLVQKEVAQRAVHRDGKRSVLSLSIEAYGAPAYIRKVPKLLFKPAPKVDSAVLHIAHISKDFFKMHHISEYAFFATIKKGFAQKRKKLSNNLGLTPEEMMGIGLPLNTRAEEVPLATWARITQRLTEKTPSST